jgi:putative lipoprotein
VTRLATLTKLTALVFTLAGSRAEAADGDAWFARDKALHASAGVAIGAGGYAGSALVFSGTRARVTSGLALALGAGAAKEWSDRGGRGTPSWRDFAWDAVGAATGVTIAWLIDRAVHARAAHTQDGHETGQTVPSAPTPPAVRAAAHGQPPRTAPTLTPSLGAAAATR